MTRTLFLRVVDRLLRRWAKRSTQVWRRKYPEILRRRLVGLEGPSPLIAGEGDSVPLQGHGN